MYWVGYKLHLDTVDGGIPVSAIVTSASVHDSQVAIPLATWTAQKIVSCYDLMDAGYDIPSDKISYIALHLKCRGDNAKETDPPFRKWSRIKKILFNCKANAPIRGFRDQKFALGHTLTLNSLIGALVLQFARLLYHSQEINS